MLDALSLLAGYVGEPAAVLAAALVVCVAVRAVKGLPFFRHPIEGTPRNRFFIPAIAAAVGAAAGVGLIEPSAEGLGWGIVIGVLASGEHEQAAKALEMIRRLIGRA